MSNKKTASKSISKIDSTFAHQVVAAGQDYGQDFDDSAVGELVEKYQQYKETCSGRSAQPKNILDIYRLDRVAQKIVKTPVFDALANWRSITDTELKDHDLRLELVERFKRALELSRINGTACLFPVLKYADTDRAVGSKVPLQRVIESGRKVYVASVAVHGGVAFSDDVELDICSDNFNKPKFYKCGNVEIHSSRAVIVGDKDLPFFDSIAGILCDFHTSFKRLAMAVRRNSAFVLKADFAEAAKYLGALQKVQSGNPKADLEIIANTKARSIAVNLNDNNVAVIGQNESIINFQAQNIDDLVKHCEQQMILLSDVSDVQLFPSVIKTGLADGGIQRAVNYSQALDRLRSESVDHAIRKMDKLIAGVHGFEYSHDSWQWEDTKAEEMLLSLRGKNSVNPSS